MTMQLEADQSAGPSRRPGAAMPPSKHAPKPARRDGAVSAAFEHGVATRDNPPAGMVEPALSPGMMAATAHQAVADPGRIRPQMRKPEPESPFYSRTRSTIIARNQVEDRA